MLLEDLQEAIFHYQVRSSPDALLSINRVTEGTTNDGKRRKTQTDGECSHLYLEKENDLFRQDRGRLYFAFVLLMTAS